VLGQKTLTMQKHYAQQDTRKALEVAAKIEAPKG